MNIFNAQPRPRVLFEAVPDDILDELKAMVPTARAIADREAVHESEFDLLVTFAPNAGARASRLHVLAFGSEWGDNAITGVPDSRLLRQFPILAHEMSIPAGTSPRLTRLISSTLIPYVPEGMKSCWGYQSRKANIAKLETTGDLNGNCTPLLHLGAERFIYAFQRRRSAEESSGLSIVLPPETTGHAQWLRVFLEMVAEIDPQSVPAPVSWTTSEDWAPPELRKVVHNLGILNQERDRAQAEFEGREEELVKELDQATKVAAAGPQRLLTADGEDLTQAVLECLRDLGFEVRDMDGYHDKKTGAKLEDLRISDTTDPSWCCLAEVKGYLRGAKVSDVPQITGRPSVAFTKETGETPSAVWHIVNAWRGTDPSSRPKAIDNDEIDLQTLTDAEGALIDTRHLFRAWRDVQDGRTSAYSVRTSLKSAMTRWTYSSPANDASSNPKTTVR
ncbi:hypothetical protein AB4Y72_19140 [Arthrobacter sp. YAF34]|uniref:hypothetical protein n=1 Tax=Arthrobacter sp. YAF34 TaxID=3233083 RepID=UPI003F903886